MEVSEVNLQEQLLTGSSFLSESVSSPKKGQESHLQILLHFLLHQVS